MAHINKLYDLACLLDTAGAWDATGLITIDGRKLPYDSENVFELGHIYMSESHLIYHRLVDKPMKGLFNLQKFRTEEMKKLLIVPDSFEETKDGQYTYTNYRMPPGSYLLLDVLKKVGKFDPRHVAWIISRLYNICSLIQYNHKVHMDISVNSILINPETHWLGLYGGWWYCYDSDERITYLPTPTYRVLPYAMISDKKAQYSAMGSQIKALALELLGNRYGSADQFTHLDPKFVEYLMRPAGDSVIADYIQWDKTEVNRIFGPRKFIPWILPKKELYT
jgi:hypothetical protein